MPAARRTGAANSPSSARRALRASVAVRLAVSRAHAVFCSSRRGIALVKHALFCMHCAGSRAPKMRRQKRGNASPFESGLPHNGRRGAATRRKSPRSTPAKENDLGGSKRIRLRPYDPTGRIRPRRDDGGRGGFAPTFLAGRATFECTRGPRRAASPSRVWHMAGIVLEKESPRS